MGTNYTCMLVLVFKIVSTRKKPSIIKMFAKRNSYMKVKERQEELPHSLNMQCDGDYLLYKIMLTSYAIFGVFLCYSLFSLCCQPVDKFSKIPPFSLPLSVPGAPSLTTGSSHSNPYPTFTCWMQNGVSMVLFCLSHHPKKSTCFQCYSFFACFYTTGDFCWRVEYLKLFTWLQFQTKGVEKR